MLYFYLNRSYPISGKVQILLRHNRTRETRIKVWPYAQIQPHIKATLSEK
jgi:hypothetical protein